MFSLHCLGRFSRGVILMGGHLAALILACPCFSQAELIQVSEDFSQDPGWEGFQNRLVCTECPTVVQDFGWAPTNFTGTGGGEIGGRVDNSRYQAYYAMPLGKPFTFDDHLSASGKVAVKHIGLRGVGYFGFFNSKVHSWRVWSSMAFRIWEEDMLGQIMFDWMSGDWQAGGTETPILLKPDGSVHAWSFEYDPDARPDAVWSDSLLEKLITSETGNGRPYELQGEEFLLERAQKEDPNVTAESLHARLVDLRERGLVEYFHRHGQHRWWKVPNPEECYGKWRLTFEGEEPLVFWMNEKIRTAPVEMDRFGLFNIQRYGEWVEVYFGDLSLNGEKIDLSQDPHWEGNNNRVTYTEPNFQGMSDYGFSETNWAGEKPGEVGGLFWRTEEPDPNFSYYGGEVGGLTLDDPISFSGSLYFLNGMTDAAMYFGYFNSKDQTRDLTAGPEQGFPAPNMMGVALADSSAVGYYFHPLVSSAKGRSAEDSGPVFTPSPERRHFTFDYDPQANQGVGRVEVVLDGHSFGFDLTPEQRDDNAIFDRFGFANVRRGGNSVEVFLDDLTYTARREKGVEPAHHKQEVKTARYPVESAGRKY